MRLLFRLFVALLTCAATIGVGLVSGASAETADPTPVAPTDPFSALDSAWALELAEVTTTAEWVATERALASLVPDGTAVGIVEWNSTAVTPENAAAKIAYTIAVIESTKAPLPGELGTTELGAQIDALRSTSDYQLALTALQTFLGSPEFHAAALAGSPTAIELVGIGERLAEAIEKVTTGVGKILAGANEWQSGVGEFTLGVAATYGAILVNAYAEAGAVASCGPAIPACAIGAVGVTITNGPGWVNPLINYGVGGLQRVQYGAGMITDGVLDFYDAGALLWLGAQETTWENCKGLRDLYYRDPLGNDYYIDTCPAGPVIVHLPPM